MAINPILDFYYLIISKLFKARYYFISERYGIQYLGGARYYFEIGGSIIKPKFVEGMSICLANRFIRRSNIKINLSKYQTVPHKFFYNIETNKEFLAFIKLLAFQ